MYTASSAFFEAISDAGVTHCFVNLGSDHPSIMEAIVKGQRDTTGKFPRIITCPSEASIPLRRLSLYPTTPSCLVSDTNLLCRWSPCLWPMVMPV